MRAFRLAATALICSTILWSHAAALPGVKHSTTTTAKFHGFLGTLTKLGGGSKPQSSTMYLQGNQQRNDQMDEKGNLISSSIIDLDREVFINIDHKKKKYTEMTFAEWKQMMEKMKADMEAKKKDMPQGESDVKVDFDVKVDRTGEKQTIAGYNTEKVILTMKATGTQASAPGQPGGSGAMIITSNQWLAKSPEGYEEMAAFGRKFAEKLGMTFDGKGNWQQSMSQAMPQLTAGMEKLAEEGKKLEGFPVRTESVFETEGQPAPEGGQMESGQTEEGVKQEPTPSVGGLLGGLGKKMAKKPKAENSSGRNVMFESTSETTEYKTTSIPAETFQVPAGYKMEKAKVN